MARASPTPPPSGAEATTWSGRRACTTTASRSISSSTPSIIVPARRSIPRLQSDQHVDAEVPEAEDLHVTLVRGVVEPHREVERGIGTALFHNVVRGAEVDAMIAGVSDGHCAKRSRVEHLIELPRHHVGLHEEAQGAHRPPGEAEVVSMMGDPT